jgi:hypothetical protein
VTDEPEPTEPTKKRHLLRRLFVFGTLVAGANAYRQRRLADNEARVRPAPPSPTPAAPPDPD